MKVHFGRWACATQWSHYETGETALVLVSEIDGSAILTATVNLIDWGVPRAGGREIWIKAWASHVGVVEALISYGVIDTPETETWGGYGNSCRAVLAKLTDAAFEELEAFYRTEPKAAQHRAMAREAVA